MSHQQLLIGKQITYTKGYELLYTSSYRYVYYQSWYSGIVQTTNFQFTAGDVTQLFNFNSSNNPIGEDTGLSPPRLFISRISPKLTPPGDAVYMRGDFEDGRLYKRDNGTGAYTVALGGNVNANDVYGQWNDTVAELILPYTVAGGIISYTSIDWGALTYTRNVTKYSAIPGSGVNSLQLFRNGSIVDGRFYVVNNATGQVGWANTTTGAYTQLVDYDNVVGVGIVCADNYLGSNPRVVVQRGTTGQGNYVDVWNTAGSLVGSIHLPDESTTAYATLRNWTFDYVNNYVWCKCDVSSDRVIYVLDLNDYTIHDVYAIADLPSGTNSIIPISGVGSPVGGIYALHAPAVTYTQIYKLG